MRRRARVVTWNGKDAPPELRELAAGRYIVEVVEEAPTLSPEEKQESRPLESTGRGASSPTGRGINVAALGR